MNFPDKEVGIPGHDKDANKKIVVTYSSINGNGFGGYGEVVMGTKGTLVLDKEQEVMLYKDSDTTTRVGVKDDKGGPGPRHAGQRQGPRSRQGRRPQRPRQPRLYRGDRALGLVHPQSVRREPAAVQGRGRSGRRGHRAGHQRRDQERQSGEGWLSRLRREVVRPERRCHPRRQRREGHGGEARGEYLSDSLSYRRRSAAINSTANIIPIAPPRSSRPLIAGRSK